MNWYEVANCPDCAVEDDKYYLCDEHKKHEDQLLAYAEYQAEAAWEAEQERMVENE